MEPKHPPGPPMDLANALSSDKDDTALILFLIYRRLFTGGDMKQLFVAAAILSAASMSAFAQNQNGQGGNNNNQGGHYGAPGPIIGGGVPGLAIGIGYGVYWLVKRRRRGNLTR